jgi:hypothetical protein
VFFGKQTRDFCGPNPKQNTPYPISASPMAVALPQDAMSHRIPAGQEIEPTLSAHGTTLVAGMTLPQSKRMGQVRSFSHSWRVLVKRCQQNLAKKLAIGATLRSLLSD